MATLVVLILLGIMSLLLMANSRSLSHLKRQLDTVELRQLQKYQPPIAKTPLSEQDPVVP